MTLRKTGASRIFFGLSSFQALAMFRRGIFYTFLAIYLRSYLGLSVTETTLFETIPMILNVLFQTFVWGNLTDRLQRRKSLIILGELCAGVGHIVLWYAHIKAPDHRTSGYVIIAGLSVIEIFWSMSNIGWSAYISDVYSVAERNAIQGKFASIGGVGRIIGAMLGGLLYDGMSRMYPGWGFKEGGIFFVSAFVMMVSVIPLLYLPEGGIAYHANAQGGLGDSTPSSEASRASLRIFAVFLVSMLLINSGSNTLGAFRGQYLDLKEGFAAAPSIISLVVNVESGALIVTGLFLGALGRRLGLQRLLVLGTGSGIVSLLLHMLAPSMGIIYLAAVFKGISDACVASSSYAFASTLIPPEKRGRYFAYYNATFFLSWGLAATLFTGPLIDALMLTGTGPVMAYKAGLASGAGLMVLGLALLLALLVSRKTRRFHSFHGRIRK
ncbi:MAG: MFS transporter [Spirochaetia bacterium]|jgi:MFS family permease|nr:MFS transporter [Spirochaetia bacterium]